MNLLQIKVFIAAVYELFCARNSFADPAVAEPLKFKGWTKIASLRVLAHAAIFLACMAIPVVAIQIISMQKAYAAPSPPVISPLTGVFSATQTVSITAEPTAVIHYTTDGSAPTTASPVYGGSFIVATNTTVKAIAELASESSTVSVSFIQIDASANSVPRTNMQLWLKADNGVELGSGQSVAKWYDNSAGHNMAFQNNASDQPSLVNNAINLLPVVNFSGSSQFLQVGSGFSNLNASTIFVVYRPTAVAGGGARLMEFGNGPAVDNVNVNLVTSTSAQFQMVLNGNPSTLTAADSVTLNQYQLLGTGRVALDASASIFTNGELKAKGPMTSSNPFVRNTNFIGKSASSTMFYQGDIAELLVYDAVLSQSNREAVEAYLFNKYQFAVHAPRISPDRGVFAGAQLVSIASPGIGAVIRYTLDGSEPNASSPIYSSAFTVNSSTTVKAKAFVSYGESATASAYLQIDPNVSHVVQTTNMLAWYKADNGISVESGKVSKWIDMTSYKNDASQLATANRPDYISSGPNALPAIGFDGTNQYLNLPAGFNDLNGASIVIVGKPATDVAANARLLDLGNAPVNSNVFIAMPDQSSFSFHVYSGANDSSVSASAVTSGQYQILEAFNEGAGTTESFLYRNGSFSGKDNTHTPLFAARTACSIGSGAGGSSQFFKGEIAEIFIFRRPLTTSERKGIEGYLMNRYAIVGPAPENSPASAVFPTKGNGPFSISPTMQPIAVSSPDYNATIVYTLDGTEPTPASQVYTAPILLPENALLKTMAVRPYGNSAVSLPCYVQFAHAAAGLARDGMQFWFKSDYGVSQTAGNVSRLNDMSGSGKNAAQSATANQVVIEEDKLNGNAILRFNGSSSFMQLPSGFVQFSGGLTALVVIKPENSGNGRIFSIGNGSGGDNIVLSSAGADATLSISQGLTNSSLTASASLNQSRYQLLEAIQSASTATIKVNGRSKASGAVNNGLNKERTLNVIGSDASGTADYFQGKIAEIVMYNRALSPDELSNAEAYLINKYQLNSLEPQAPVLSMNSGTLPEPAMLVISAPADCKIHYTQDGSEPDISSPVYSAPLQISFSQTVKAACEREGIVGPSSTAEYTLNGTKWPRAKTSDSELLDFSIKLPLITFPE